MSYKKHPYKKEHICISCKEKFIASAWNHKICSKCNPIIFNTNRKLNQNIYLPTSTVGAIAELLIACDLLKKGYEVFRALSQSCSCDLIARKNGTNIEIEVRTGYKTQDIYHQYRRIINLYPAHLLALVIHQKNEIIYYPFSPI